MHYVGGITENNLESFTTYSQWALRGNRAAVLLSMIGFGINGILKIVNICYFWNWRKRDNYIKFIFSSKSVLLIKDNCEEQQIEDREPWCLGALWQARCPQGLALGSHRGILGWKGRDQRASLLSLVVAGMPSLGHRGSQGLCWGGEAEQSVLSMGFRTRGRSSTGAQTLGSVSQLSRPVSGVLYYAL